jgi:glucosylceramidase
MSRSVLALWLVIGCAPPGTDDPCVGAAALGDPPVDSTVSGFRAGQWWSSESHAFQLDNPDTIWFQCPRAIAHKLDRQPDLPITAIGGDAATLIDLDPSTTFQSILGTGISMEESSVANLWILPPDKRLELLTRMFDPVHGMGLNLVRVTIGTSDFTGTDWYTYDEGPSDANLSRFSIQRDLDLGIIDVLRQILAINPAVTFFASPWSPPGWMKDSGQIAGGSLLTDHIPALAGYLRSFVEAYRDQGIPIYALTLQNEPRSQSDDMPTCFVTAEQEAALVKALKAELAAAGLPTKAWVYDHNFDAAADYAGDLFRDTDALAAADGIAFHDYAGDPSAMTALHDLYPGLDMVFTEKTLWGVAGVERAAQYFRNWSTTYTSWLTMLDQDGLPNRGPNSQKPRRFMRSVTYTEDTYYATPEHYLFGLYSRFVQAGARRIASDAGSTSAVTDVAFVNPDGTIAAVVINQTDEPQTFALRSEGNQIWAQLDGKTAATYVWHIGLGPSAASPIAP